MHPLKKNEQRILIVDDLERIHEDYRKILGGEDETQAAGRRLLADATALFGVDPEEAPASGEAATPAAPRNSDMKFRLDSAYQGQEALELIRAAKEANDAYKVAFIDMRMPPGWDGLFTIERIREIDNDVQIVICSAYSDYSWREIQDRVGRSEDLLILKKPFDSIEVHQMASALAEKWNRKREESQARARLRDQAQDSQAQYHALAHGQRSRDAKLAGMLDSLSRLVSGYGVAPKVDTSESNPVLLSSKLADLSDYFALASGKLVLAREVVDLATVLDHCVAAASTLFQANEHDIAVAYGPGLPRHVWGDHARIRRVVSALIEDVALRSASPSLRVALALTNQEGKNVRLRFSCTADSPMSVDGDGNGLGVADLLSVAMGGACESDQNGAYATLEFEVDQAETQRAS